MFTQYPSYKTNFRLKHFHQIWNLICLKGAIFKENLLSTCIGELGSQRVKITENTEIRKERLLKLLFVKNNTSFCQTKIPTFISIKTYVLNSLNNAWYFQLVLLAVLLQLEDLYLRNQLIKDLWAETTHSIS